MAALVKGGGEALGVSFGVGVSKVGLECFGGLLECGVPGVVPPNLLECISHKMGEGVGNLVCIRGELGSIAPDVIL